MIADDPLADNTDVYAFRSPDAPNTVTLVADYIPFQLPQGGPNFYSFGENIRYEIHVKNKVDLVNPNNPNNICDDITYRFTFTRTNEDPTTFFRVRLGKENLKNTYKCEESRDGGKTFTTIVAAGAVPAPNIGPRSITSAAGLGKSAGYQPYAESTIQTLGDGTKIFCGPVDDPFFTDLGAIFDLGGVRSAADARDGLARKNVHTIVMQIPIEKLSKTGMPVADAKNILDPDYIIGVWASASRLSMRTIKDDGTRPESGDWVQVSRLGMPLTNEVVQNIGQKDEWNSKEPFYLVPKFDARVKNPELGLYMADNTPMNGAAPKPAGQTYYGEAVPGFAPLRIQTKSLAGLFPAGSGLENGFDFRNGAAGLSPLYGNAATDSTALAPAAKKGFGEYLLNVDAANPGAGNGGMPRSVDLLPIFHTGVPNLIPYQLATGKTGGNPLTAGKPFINNFLPTFGDMLRLNMAVPVTPRNSADFSSEGLLAAAVLGLTDSRYNTNKDLQNIPNMDGFPNGRRLEDDVTRIELQAVSGVVLAAVGLWYDDYMVGTTASPVTPQLGGVLGFTTHIEKNDTTFRVTYPYVQTPWSGTNAQRVALAQRGSSGLGLSPNLAVAQAYPNPFVDNTTFRFELNHAATLSIVVYDNTGRKVGNVADSKAYATGVHEVQWKPSAKLAPGVYIATLYSGKTVLQSINLVRQ